MNFNFRCAWCRAWLGDNRNVDYIETVCPCCEHSMSVKRDPNTDICTVEKLIASPFTLPGFLKP